MNTIIPKRLWIPLLSFFLFTHYSTAQTQISGAVLGVQNTPLSYANVLLLNPADSSLVLGNITDENGKYAFDAVQTGSYMLSISMIGYQDQKSEVFKMKDEPGLYTPPIITLTTDDALLDEVEVVEKRALFEQKIDRLVVNVDKSITLSGSTALEVLKRSPGVAVNPQTNSISMSGKDGVIVMMNGKISRMPADAVVQLLGGMNADNIEKIELIHTPPANFEAQGNAGFINIVFKKSQDDGINGGFSVNAGYGKKEKAGASINLNFRKNKINLFGNYSWKYNNNPQLFTNYRSFIKDGKLIENIGESERDPTRTHVQNARLGIDVHLSDKTIIGGLATWSNRYWKMNALNSVQSLEDGSLINRISIPNGEVNEDNSFLGNINLQHQFSENQKLNIDLDYAYFINRNPSNYVNRFFDGNDQLIEETTLRVSKDNPLDIWVGKIDYTRNFGKKVIVELGLKGTTTSFDNDVLVEDLIQQTWTEVPLFSSEAMMTEKVGAAYTAVLWKLNEKTDVKLGLRYEYSDINLGTTEEPNIVDRQRGRWFPSLFISNKINETNNVQFSYSRRINRPGFKQLAPWFIFFDPSTVSTGNPALLASISDAIRGSYIWKTAQLDLQYTYTDNMIGRHQPSVDLETNTQVNGAKNFLDAHLAAASLSFPFKPAKWWEIRSSWTVQWMKINDKVEGKKIAFDNSSWYMNGSSSFTLPQKYTIEISGTYFSPSLGGAVLWQSFNSVDFGIQKEFENNNGTLKFAINDIFNGSNWRGSLDDPDVDFVYRSLYGFSERVFRLTYSRRFGNNKLKGERKRTTGSVEEQRRVN